MLSMSDPGPSAPIESRAASFALAVGVALMLLKFAAWGLTGSAAVFSDAIESVVNVLASAFALYSVRLAHRPADAEHPYGHGKVEFLSAGFEGGLICVAAIIIVVQTFDTLLFHPVTLQRLDVGLGLTSVAMAANGAMGLYLIRLGRRQGSITLEADGKHLLSDAITSVAALVALALVRVTGWKYADPIAALAIAAYIARIGLYLLRRSVAGLMDEQDASDKKLITSLLDAHLGDAANTPRICSYHKLRHRHAGRYHWVDFHVMVPPSLNVEQGHAIASALEHEIERGLVEGDATAHVEPCTDGECDHCRTQQAAAGPEIA